MKPRCAHLSRAVAPSGGSRVARPSSSSSYARTIVTSSPSTGATGLLIAYHSWSPVARADEARVFVLFRHIAGHPRAPAALQQSIDRLTFARDEG
ncbi:MAG TPA: hypothetical protein VHB97_25235 [Polyangia bacterium]|nr:hypothetical protein [Polyangia bacterium]